MKKGMTLKVLSLVLFCFIWFLVSGTDVLAQKEGGILRYPLPVEPRPIDPHINFGDGNCDVIITHVYENLVWIDQDFKIGPALATSWKMAPDGKSYVFHLRKGVKFHDGTPFNAKAVAANFDRISKGQLKAWRYAQTWFKSTEIIDDHTIRINLTGVYVPFLTEMAQLYTRMVSPLAIEKYGPDLGKNPSGTGPWKFSKWNPGESILFSRNPDYWAGRPLLDGLLFKFNPDQTARTMAFESDALDLMDQPSFVDIDRLKKSGKYKTSEQVTNVIFFLVFNTMRKPFDQKEVRHAIKYAVNKPGIVKAFLGEHVVVADGFGPVFLPETLSRKEAFPYDPEKAKAILKQLGWNPGPDGILMKDGVRFEFSMMTPYGRYPMDKQITEAVQANLRDIGMDAKLDVVEGAAFINWVQSDPEPRRTSKVGMVTLTRPLGATLENALVQHYHSEYFPKKGFNVASYANKEFDKLMESARTITDDRGRAGVYRKAQEILFEDLPVLPIYFFKKIMFYRPYVHNFQYCPPAYVAAPHVTHKTWMDK